jgi:C4-dicarboxylate transporter DctM subunit
VYALLVGVFVYRKINRSVLAEVFMRTAQTTGIVMLLIAASSILAWYLTIQEVPRAVTDYLIRENVSNTVFIFFIIVLFLFLGCIMEGIAAMIMVVPLLMPVFKTLGIDPLHAGIIIVATVGIGLFTPPVGAALFVACSIGKVTIEECSKAMMPYLITVTLCIFLMVFFPPVITIIPKVLGLMK